MLRARFSLPPESVAAAALVAQAFTLYLSVLLVAIPATDAQWARADPILVILPRTPTLALVLALGIGSALVWTRRARPTREALRRAAAHALVGALVAIAVAGIERAVVGPHLPAFVPPEESAGPGMLLSEAAGYAEEIVFRLGVLPIAFGALSPRLPPIAAALGSALVVGVVFALLHAAGSPEWSWPHFATRVIFPGVVMSLGALAISPSFVVGAHCSAHLVIPLLFV